MNTAAMSAEVTGAPAPAFEITKAHRAAFERDGYIVLRALFDRGQCAAMAEVGWSLLPPGFDRSGAAPWRGRLQDCCTDVPVYQRKGLMRMKSTDGFRSHAAIQAAVYEHPTLRSIFEQMLGMRLARLWVRGINPNIPFPKRVSLNQLLGNRLDPEVRGGLWDRLTVRTPPQAPIVGHLETHAMDMGAFVYLTDVAKDGGALGVWPGSHRLFRLAFSSPIDFAPNRLYKRFFHLLQGYRPVMIDGQAGDTILFHNRLLHSNTLNRSNQVRHLLVIDALGHGWVQRAAASPGRGAERKALYPVKDLAAIEPAARIISRLVPDPLGAFLAMRPRLNAWLRGISQDPLSAARSRVSQKIRHRREGDLWVVVSQGEENWNSYKLDAHGAARHGRYTVKIDGRRVAASCGGVIVEPIPAEEGLHRIAFTGRFAKSHYLRVVRTATPFSRSPTLLKAVIPAGATSFQGEFKFR